MTADPERFSGNRERPPRFSSKSNQSASTDESPDLLRWRADLLLDEMMLGAVDVSAADSVTADPGGADSSPSASGSPAPGSDSAGEGASGYAASPMDSGPGRQVGDRADYLSAYADVSPFDPEPADPEPADPEPAEPPYERPVYSPNGSAPVDSQRSFTPDRSVPEPQTGANGDAGAARSERLYSLEQRYEAYRRVQENTVQASPAPPSTIAQDPVRPAESSAPRSAPTEPRAPVPPNLDPPDVQTQWASAPEKWDWQDFGTTPGQPAEPPPAAPAANYRPAGAAPPDSAVRQDPAQFVSAMSVLSNSKKRSTLLPRMSTLDVDALNQEIAALHGEIGSLLPVGNESSERARHLLDKAYSILQSDPMRSAEVEYYMQQVRTIVQRLRQARHWSDLYRDRLRMYLSAWLFLSLLVLVARFVFQLPIEAVTAGVFGIGFDSLVVQHAAALVGAVAAGALGGAAGAIYTMNQHMRSEHSLFDRKYGLRGLMLPIIPVLVAAVGHILFVVLFLLLQINPSANLVAGTVPALAALLFGFSQESIYGTRG